MPARPGAVRHARVRTQRDRLLRTDYCCAFGFDACQRSSCSSVGRPFSISREPPNKVGLHHERQRLCTSRCNRVVPITTAVDVHAELELQWQLHTAGGLHECTSLKCVEQDYATVGTTPGHRNRIEQFHVALG